MTTIDDFNYFSDRRARATIPGIPTVILEVIDEDGERFDEERELPWRWGVCPVCEGKGSHVNPAIDCNGLTADDFAEDPDFAEDYFSGRYDMPCNGCGGRTTVPVLDEEQCTDDELQAWREQLHAEDEDRRAFLAELRAGA